MIRIAIVEDDQNFQGKLVSHIKTYELEKKVSFVITQFYDGYQIIEKYSANYDIIFMDIQMKLMDGMETAKQIRKLDEDVVIIFITNMAQYAIQGYQVNALDYVLKPISYFAFSQELDKAVKRLKTKEQNYLMVAQDKGVLRVRVSDIRYLESQGHNIIVHMDRTAYSFRSTMKELEQKLNKDGFVRCNSGYLVNLRHVKGVKQNMVIFEHEELQISRPRKKAFMVALTDYLGGK